jgi:endonuclease/exonuclease/phosphatase family metal-dependent hydrolase
MIRRLLVTYIVFALAVFVGGVAASSPARTLRVEPEPNAPYGQEAPFCLLGQQPHFNHGFAFLKSQLGAVMGEPLECEHYDAAGNAFQRTTTGQAFYQKDTNTPMFTRGNRHWAWTPVGLREWVDNAGVIYPQTKRVAPERPNPSATTVTSMTSVRVMSYNILFGAGVDPAWEQAAAQLSPFAYPGNRLAEIMVVIKAAKPDILGLQEAAGWNNGSPSLAQQVADELGMNYFLAQVDNGLHVVLFTKFEIVAAENLSPQVGNVGSLRAELALPDGQPLHVFVVHLDPFSTATRTRQLTLLTQEMALYRSALTLLLGDLNYYCLDNPEQCQEYNILNKAGWRLVQAGRYKIDQIWTSPPLAQSVEAISFPGATFDISDHLPVGTIIEIVPTTP